MSEFISKEDVFNTLENGFEVLYISAKDIQKVDGYTLKSTLLSKRVFRSIEYIIKNAEQGDLFIKVKREE